MSLDWYTKTDLELKAPTGCICLYMGSSGGVLRINSPECSQHEEFAVIGSLTPDEILALMLEEISARRTKTN